MPGSFYTILATANVSINRFCLAQKALSRYDHSKKALRCRGLSKAALTLAIAVQPSGVICYGGAALRYGEANLRYGEAVLRYGEAVLRRHWPHTVSPHSAT